MCNRWLHVEEEDMQNALRTGGAGAPPAGTRAAGRTAARLGTGQPAQTSGQRWRAFALLVVAYVITIMDFTIVNVALPTIGRKLHFPESDLQWVVTAYGLTFAGFQVGLRLAVRQAPAQHCG
jgi:predicted MFS family arabinose efflux permease